MPVSLGRVVFLIIALMILEMYLLIEIGGKLGALSTIALVFLTATVGIWMLRLQGAATLRRATQSAVSGQAPVREAAEGVMLIAGGVMLLLPGFFTDALGFLCLLPPTRALLLRLLAPRVGARTARHGKGRDGGPNVIEGEWRQD